MGPRLGRVEYLFAANAAVDSWVGFNGATLRTRGILNYTNSTPILLIASMGPRLGRVEYGGGTASQRADTAASMGPRLGRVEYDYSIDDRLFLDAASMGPRLGRVEYLCGLLVSLLVTRLQWGHA